MIFGKRRDVPRLIDGTRVACPLRGVDVQIEECLACGKLRNIVNDDLPYVICGGKRTDLRANVVL